MAAGKRVAAHRPTRQTPSSPTPHPQAVLSRYNSRRQKCGVNGFQMESMAQCFGLTAAQGLGRTAKQAGPKHGLCTCAMRFEHPTLRGPALTHRAFDALRVLVPPFALGLAQSQDRAGLTR